MNLPSGRASLSRAVISALHLPKPYQSSSSPGLDYLEEKETAWVVGYSHYKHLVMKRNWETTEYIKTVKLTQADYDFINANKHKKSLAGFLKLIIKTYRDGNVSVRKMPRK